MSEPFDNFDKRHTGKFFEEFTTTEAPVRCLGVRIVEDARGRELGIRGRIDLTLKEPIVLLRCFKQIKVPASEKRPLKVFTTLQRICGK